MKVQMEQARQKADCLWHSVLSVVSWHADKRKTLLYKMVLQLGRHVVPVLMLPQRPLDANH